MTDAVRGAHATGAALVIRGGGTKSFHPLSGEFACAAGLPGRSMPASVQILDTRRLGGIVSYVPSELVITALAGTPLAELEAALAERGQYLPFEPPHFGSAQGAGATVGGMVAAGLCGPARACAGAVRDFVLGVQMLNGRGELLRFGGQVMKNVAGYDISRLMAASWGQLGLLVEVSLKVLPVPSAEVTLALACSESRAREYLNGWAAQPLPLNASCWEGGRLLLRLRGARAAVQAAQARLAAQAGAQPFADGSSHASGGRSAALTWQLLREQTHPFFARQPGQALWRLSLPDTAPDLKLGATLVEWLGAQRWLRAPLSQGERIQAVAAQTGGHAQLFRAPPETHRAAHAGQPALPAPLAHIHQALKAEFDPAGIFNPA